jgi:hypothetical protein
MPNNTQPPDSSGQPILDVIGAISASWRQSIFFWPSILLGGIGFIWILSTVLNHVIFSVATLIATINNKNSKLP